MENNDNQFESAIPEEELTRIENDAQAHFNREYITATEICERLKISRPTILKARRRRQLPNPIDVCQQRVFIWERSKIEPYLASWEISLNRRREIIQ